MSDLVALVSDLVAYVCVCVGGGGAVVYIDI